MIMDRTYGHLADCVLQSTTKLSDEHSSTNDPLPPDGLHSTSNPKQNYGNVDLNGSKVIRLVRAKQATKRKSSLDTLIEVVQKELLRVNGQSTCPSPCSSPPPTSSSTPTLLSSCSSSTSSSQRPKRIPTPFNDDQPESNETIEEIVRDTVDKLVAITLLNNAPFFVNMLTTPPDSTKSLTNGNTSTTKSSSSHPPATSDLALLSSAASDIRNSMQQQTLSPSKTLVSSPTVLMTTPRLVNFQTVLPKPTTNIQIGNTKIILVSPPTSSVPVKLVKFTPSTTIPKNVQIVLPTSTDSIPAASQEVTITSSPPLTIGKPRRRSSTSSPIDKPVGKILRPIAKVLPVFSSSNSEEILPPINKINLTTPTPTTTATTTTIQRPTNNHGPMIYRMTSVNPNVPVFRVRTSASTTETKPLINGTTSNGPVSVLACFKTTKKRNKERAIMPRPTSEPVEPPSSNIRLIPSTSITTPSPTRLKISRPAMEDKGIQCINEQGEHEEEEEEEEVPLNSHSSEKISIKREMNEFDHDDDDDSWTVAADTLLRNVLSQYCFRFLDMNCQQNLSSRLDTIQANLVSGMIPTLEQFFQSVMEVKNHLLTSGLSKMSTDNLEKLFHYFQIEYPKICQRKSLCRTNERKRTRRH